MRRQLIVFYEKLDRRDLLTSTAFEAVQIEAGTDWHVFGEELTQLDVDGDGFQDIVLVGRSQSVDDAHGIEWFPNRGTGEYDDPHRVLVEFESPTLGDIDADGDLDVVGYFQQEVISDDGPTIVARRNLGGGVFGETEVLHQIVADGGIEIRIHDLRIGDLNADGNSDIVYVTTDTGSRGSTRISWLPGLAGEDLFGEPQQVGRYLVWSHFAQDDIQLADLDLDGDLDVVTRYETTSTPQRGRISWFENRANGEFDLIQTISTTREDVFFFDEFVIADMDGDSDPDIVVNFHENGDRWEWQENSGDGTFTTAHQLPEDLVGFVPRWDDLDGDGDADLLTRIGDDVVQQLNDGDGVSFVTDTLSGLSDSATILFPLEVSADGPQVLIEGDRNGIRSVSRATGTDFEPASLLSIDRPRQFDSINFADADGDGDVDLWLVSGKELLIRENVDGRGTFGEVTVGFVADELINTFKFERAIGDLNDDGVMDVTYSVVDRTFYRLGLGDLTFGAPVQLAEAPSLPSLGDVDGDGDTDILLASSSMVFQNQGDGSFEALEFEADEFATSRIATVIPDIDGDGLQDFLREDSQGRLVLTRNAEGMNFGEESILSNENFIPYFRAVDVDADGDLDVVFDAQSFGLGGGSSLGLLRNVDGEFTLVQELAVPPIVSGRDAFHFEDYDLDGDLDLFYRSYRPDENFFVEYDSELHQFKSAVATESVDLDLRVATADVDGDGDVDLLTGELDHLRLYRNSAIDRADLDDNGSVDGGDIDRLFAHLINESDDKELDLSGDGAVDADDVAFLITNRLDSQFGDVNLDGQVGFADFLVISTNFGNPGGWADGDMDGDGAISFEDFLAVSFNFGWKRDA